MCGRFALTVDGAALQLALNLESVPAVYVPRYNIAPSQPIALVTNEAPHQLTFHKWGLVPPWAKDLAIGNRMINARAETVAEKPSFRNAFKRRRCIIPASGFFEWQTTGKMKQPQYIYLPDQPVFALAGLWEIWTGPDGEQLRTATILTTEANAFMADIHNRMPVIIHPHDYAEWLSPTEMKPVDLQPLLRSVEAEEMAAYPVSTLVNSPANDTPAMVEPLAS